MSPALLLALLLAPVGCEKTGPIDSGAPDRGVDTDPGGSGSPGAPGGPGGANDTGAGSSDSDDDSGNRDSDSGGPPDTPLVLDYPEQRVGMFYLAWHTFAAQAITGLAESERLTVEHVIRDGGLDFSDMIWDRGLYDSAAAFHYHQEPSIGFYCLYRKRSGDPPLAEPYDLPDCPDVAAVAATHASQLWEAGVDFVYMDLTNLPTESDFGDVLGLRPLEVLLEEWGALRAAGVPTPQIAGWVPAVVADAPMYERVLDVYDEHWDSDVLFRPEPGSAPALFVVNAGEADALGAIAARGVTPVPLWGNLDAATLDAGVAGWMQPCTSGGSFTTVLQPGTPCQQDYTTTSPLGTVVSVSRSYQIGYASLPFQASGRNGGLTFQLQLATALAVQPDVLLINAWNEHIAQPQPNPWSDALGTLGYSMGVTDTPAEDATAPWLWVDAYGAEFDRDFEPTVEDGGAGYALLASCLRVWRSGATSCDDASEACCQTAPGMAPVWSLKGAGGGAWDTDHLLSVNPYENDALLAGGDWEAICNPTYGPPGAFCGGGADGAGPFLLYRESGADRALLQRCNSGVGHFFSLDPACEGTTVEDPLGYLSTVKTSETPRPLRRCYNSSGQVHFHWLDERCPSGVNEEALLGYVR